MQEVETTNKKELNIGSVQQLKQIKTTIENMSKFNHIAVLRILTKHLGVDIMKQNENKSGVHVNLSDLSDDALLELLSYIKYVNMQETELKHGEDEQKLYKDLLSK